MSKFIPLKIPFKIRQNLQRRLFEKMAKLTMANEMEKFLRDLLTESELVMLVRRLQIAKMLLDEAPYEEIKRELKAGDSTIMSVRKKLESGKGGYLKFIKEL